MNDFWTIVRIGILTEAWDAGDLARDIGARLGTSKDAVIGKARRLGLAPRAVAPPRTISKRAREIADHDLWLKGKY